jgi:YHS domain-containing protein
MELMDGRELPGKAELAIEHEGIEYRFATQENMDAFKKDPAKYEVFDGGACGAMGALSEMGDARGATRRLGE